MSQTRTMYMLTFNGLPVVAHRDRGRWRYNLVGEVGLPPRLIGTLRTLRAHAKRAEAQGRKGGSFGYLFVEVPA